VVHQVGVGVLGPVFRGYDPEQDRAVAIKAFPLDVTPERARELAADLERLQALGFDHPAVIAPLAAGAEGATAYLVQEYFVAESADVALKQYGPAPVPDATRLVGQLAGALDAAAEVGVHHGALHPRDILVAPHEVRLTGLGVSEALERVGVRVPVRRPYSAPERASGGPASAAADLFSLACVAFELVTGRRPAQSGDVVTADTSTIQAADAVALGEVFARALSPRAEDRYPSALAFAAALKHALTGEPLAAGAESGRARPRRAARSAPRAASAAPPAALPADLLLAEPLRSEPQYDVSDALLRQEAQSAAAAPEPLSDLPSSPAPGSTPLPAFLESYALADTEPAPLRPAAADSAPPATAPSRDAATEETVVQADIETVRQVPDREPVAEPLPLAADVREEKPVRASVPAPPPAQPVSAPRRGLVPLVAMLAAGIALGIPLGYLMAPSGQTAPPAATAPLPAPPAAAPPAAAPPPVPAAPAPATANAAPAPVPATPAPTPSAPPPATRTDTATPAPAARKPADVQAPAARKPPPPRPKTTAAFVGSLSVVSRPAGATVTLDGRIVGVTPLTLPEVAAGSHAVRLDLAGYLMWSASTQVVAGEQKKVNASLERRERRSGG
jgi:eukaryotic-like serine/threonine-protein kinase